MNKFVLAILGSAAGFAQTSLSPSTMPRIGAVDERFQSFNVEMVEVTGGRFWKPFGKEVDAILNAPKSAGGPVGMDPHGQPGGIALLIINTDRTGSQSMEIPTASVRYTLTARNLESGTVQLNGAELRLAANGELPPLAGVPAKPGAISFAPASIAFLAVPQANNNSCR